MIVLYKQFSLFLKWIVCLAIDTLVFVGWSEHERVESWLFNEFILKFDVVKGVFILFSLYFKETHTNECVYNGVNIFCDSIVLYVHPSLAFQLRIVIFKLGWFHMENLVSLLIYHSWHHTHHCCCKQVMIHLICYGSVR